jgi:transcriptional regulator with XRE-family HTH domain
MRRPDPATILRERVKSAVDQRGWGGRRALAKAMGLKGQSTITQWLHGQHNPGVDKLAGIAAFLDCSVSDLFSPVLNSEEKLNQAALDRGGSNVDSSPLRKGASPDGPTGIAVRAENDRLRQRLDQLSEHILLVRDAATDLADLVTGDHAHARVPAARARKSRSR